MSAPLPVTLIVLNWNGRPFLPACLTSLLSLDYPHYTIILVDNASDDDSVAYVRQHFPQIQLQVNPGNLGFAAGNNAALHQLTTPLAVLLNPDIIVSPNWLRHLLGPMLADEQIGVAGGKLLYPDGRLIQHAGGFVTAPQAFPGHYGLLEEDAGQYELPRQVDYVIGAAMAIRRDLLGRIGLLDEGFFLYYEDTDFCQRAQRAGYQVVYVPQATAVHLESAVTRKGSPTYLRHFHTGRWRFLLKHYDLDEVVSQTVPAEQRWLDKCDPVERWAAAHAYRQTLMRLPSIWSARQTHGGSGTTAGQRQQVAGGLVELRQRAWSATGALKLLQSRGQVQPQPFVSRVPVFGRLIARFRQAWNDVSARWYVDELLAQQNEWNQLVVEGLERQTAQLAEGDGRQSALVQEALALTEEIGRLRERVAAVSRVVGN